VQKKSGRIVPGVKEEIIESDQEEVKPKKAAKSKAVKIEDDQPESKKKRKTEGEEPPAKKSKAAPKKAAAGKTKTVKVEEPATANSNTEPAGRRSGRLQGKRPGY
jgi:formamidopyrimidine-DNA glycosylase